MSRKLFCDVCDTEYPGETPMIQVTVPLESGPMYMDVCDPECLMNLASSLAGEQELEEPPQRTIHVPPEEDRVIPPVADDPVFRPRTEDDVEAVTGVVRRGRHTQ